MNELAGSVSWPDWARELKRVVRFKRLVVLSGNVRDLFVYPDKNSKPVSGNLRDVLFALLSEPDAVVGAWNMVDGLGLPPDAEESGENYAQMIRAAPPPAPRSSPPPLCASDPLETALAQIARYLGSQDRTVFIVEDAELLASSPTSPDRPDRLGLLRLVRATQGDVGRGVLVLVCQNSRGIPPWVTVSNPQSATVEIPTPRRVERRSFLETVEDRIDGTVEELADLTDGMSLRDLNGIKRLAWLPENPPQLRPKELVDSYRFGVRVTEWDSARLLERLQGVEQDLGRRVMGQPAAIAAASAVLRRAALGLSGIGNRGRPRGVLFFAGPTGVGKTELAKAIAEFVFGSDEVLVRFDMTEYQHAHADQRLLGAPPGYVGYEEGGQLTEAMRANARRVLLFDECEKAHPSILDKFLQVLEDGRITDGRGETVTFSESIIIFTSNAGIYEIDGATGRPREDLGTRKPILRVDPAVDTDYADVRRKILEGVEAYFKHYLGRPELLSRIGRNVVVFDFVRRETMQKILEEKVLRSIAEFFLKRWGLAVRVDQTVVDHLLDRVSADVASGARGVGNLVEVALLNPLASWLVAEGGPLAALAGKTLVVTGVREVEGTNGQEIDVHVES